METYLDEIEYRDRPAVSAEHVVKVQCGCREVRVDNRHFEGKVSNRFCPFSQNEARPRLTFDWWLRTHVRALLRPVKRNTSSNLDEAGVSWIRYPPFRISCIGRGGLIDGSGQVEGRRQSFRDNLLRFDVVCDISLVRPHISTEYSVMNEEGSD